MDLNKFTKKVKNLIQEAQLKVLAKGRLTDSHGKIFVILYSS